MKADLTEIIADLLLQAAPDLTTRFEYQAEALQEIKCTNPALAQQWVDRYEIKYLFSILSLGDKEFAERMPALANFAEPERRQLIATLEHHIERCQHCALKRGYDLELDERIKEVCRQNSPLLLQLLEEDAAEYSADDPLAAQKLERTCSRSQ